MIAITHLRYLLKLSYLQHVFISKLLTKLNHGVFVEVKPRRYHQMHLHERSWRRHLPAVFVPVSAAEILITGSCAVKNSYRFLLWCRTMLQTPGY